MPPKRKRSQATSAGPDPSSAATTTESPKPRSQASKDSQSAPSAADVPLTHPNGYRTNPPPTDRPVRVYADGVFDLFHLGHMRQLKQAKTIFPDTYLIVGVTGDVETHRRKGLTVLSAAERAESVRHCKWVDEVIEDCPWIVTPEFMEEHRFDYVAHDDLPYGAAEGDDIYASIKETGKFLVTQRTEGVSTTGIITKIVRDYEKYIGRQLKRGTTRQELNISWLKKNEIDLKRHVAELRDAIRTNWSTAGQEIGKDIRSFWTPSRGTSPTRRVGGSPWMRPSRKTPGATSEENLANGTSPAKQSPLASAAARLSHLNMPASPRPTSPLSPGEKNERGADFAAGYALGLMGGIRQWMTKNKRNVESTANSTSSDEGDEEDEGEVEAGKAARGRKRRRVGENTGESNTQAEVETAA